MQARNDIVEQTTQQALVFKQQMIAQEQFDVSVRRSWKIHLGIQRGYMEHDFNLSRTRAQDDFSRQQKWQMEDFHLFSSARKIDYNLSRARGNADFNMSLRRTNADFNLSRKRQEQDYQHSVVMMTEQSAKSMMDIYKRVQVQQTNSASWLLVNSADQIQRMQKQEADLQKLRKMGMKDDTIQQLGLTDPANQQQLARFTDEMADNPEMVKKFNQQVMKRLKAAKKLVTDESSTEWEEFRRQYSLARNRAQDDFERSTRRSLADHQRQLRRMAADFRRSMARMAEDLHIQMGRSQELFTIQMRRGQEDYNTSIQRMVSANARQMKRARADMDLVARGMAGDIYETFARAANTLRGVQGKLAKGALKDLKDMGTALARVNYSIAKNFWTMFDLPGKAPKWAKPDYPDTPDMSTSVGLAGTRPFRAAGGVLDGYTPGQDVHHFHSKTGGDLHLSGGEAIMVPEWTKQQGGAGKIAEMNRKARQGQGHRFASGGTFANPDRRVSQDGEPLSAISAAQLLLAEKLSNKNISVMQGSWQPHTSYSGSSHMGPGVMDTSPGNFSNQYWLRRVGFAAWGRNFPGAASAGSGAHVHSVSRLDPGARNHAQLSSFARGEDGLGGKDYGPNPSVLPGIMTLLKQFGSLSLSDGSGGGGGPVIPSFASITKAYYKSAEEAAAKIHIGGGDFDRGAWSNKINKHAKQRYDELKKDWAKAHPGSSGNYADPGTETGSNQQLVKKAMHAQGWNQWPQLYQLIMKESGFRNTAQNPTSSAYGMFQFLDSTWGGYGGKKTSDPWKQAVYGMRYIKERYGSPAGALKFHHDHNWYGEGGLFDGPKTIGVGESGPEAVIPLNAQGSDFMSDVLAKVNGGLEAKNGSVRGSTPRLTQNVYNYQIDRSTNFTGPIHVNANNPRELLGQLQAQQRLKALSQPQLAGAR